MKTAVIVIDMVNDFVTGALANKKAEAIIPSIQSLLDVARKNKIPVIYCSDAHQKDDNEFKVWPSHCIKGTNGAHILKELAPQREDIVLEKQTYSAFFNTELHDTLQQLGVERLILCGVVTNICVCHTAADAFFYNYDTIVPKETTTAINDRYYKQGLMDMEELYGVKTLSLQETIPLLSLK